MPLKKQRKNNNPKQTRPEKIKLFCAAYIANGNNGQRAAADAGWAKSSARAVASRLLKDPKVKEIIKAGNDALIKKHDMTADSVLKQLSAIVHFDMRKLYRDDGSLKDIKELDDETASALSSIEIDDDMSGYKDDRQLVRTTKVKIFDKNSAIEKAMKYFGLLKEAGLNINAEKVYISAEDERLG